MSLIIRRHPLQGHFTHVRNGQVVWQSDWRYNNLADEGEENLLDVGYRNAANQTAFYGRLFNDTVVDTDTLSSVAGEPVGNGYGAVTWNANATDFPTLALQGANYRLDSVQRTFTAVGGAWSTVNTLIIATVASGTSGLLYNYIALGQAVTLQDGDDLHATIQVTAS